MNNILRKLKDGIKKTTLSLETIAKIVECVLVRNCLESLYEVRIMRVK